MQSIYAASFLEKSSAKAVDKSHRKKINFIPGIGGRQEALDLRQTRCRGRPHRVAGGGKVV